MAPDEVTGTTETESEGATPEVVKDDAGRTIINDRFTFKVPEGHPEQGDKKHGTYSYSQCAENSDRLCANDEQAAEKLIKQGWRLVDLVNQRLKAAQAFATLLERKWNFTDMVNDELKSRARSNAYQNAVMPYKPSEVSQADIRTRMIRDLIRSGVSEALATSTIDTVLASKG